MKYISISILSALVLLLAYSGCYYDKEATLYPNAVCDSTNVTYSLKIAPIIQEHCLSCHAQSSSLGGGVVLEGYDNLKSYANGGLLVGTISYAIGFTAMPASGKMSDCNIALIKKWVDAGAPNN